MTPQVYLPLVATPGPRSFFVSKTGHNTDGRSWAKAWSELDQINWDLIEPGDTIFLDGGVTEMVYTTSLEIAVSGSPTLPIRIELAREPGRDGRAVIFGGRSIPLPYCGQLEYEYQTDGVRQVGIRIYEVSWVIIEGTKWGGITIYGHNRNGIRLSADSSHIVVRNVEIYDNGYARYDGDWSPDQPGVDLRGTNIAFERAIIHDNGQDAFQSGGGIGNFALRQSWLYNQRSHPLRSNEPFNECTHSDGIQVYDGGDQAGLLIEESIIGPGFTQGLMLGDHGDGHSATVHNVSVRNTLIVHHHGPSSNAGINTSYDPDDSPPNNPPTNYRIDHVTVVRDPNTCAEPEDCPSATWNSLRIHGWGHRVTNSIFYGGTYLDVNGDPVALNNFRWMVKGPDDIATEANPMFVDNDFSGLEGGLDFDFTIQNPALPAGVGSSVTSIGQLLNLPDPVQSLP